MKTATNVKCCLQKDIGGLWYLRQYMKDSQKSYSEAKESCHKVQFAQLYQRVRSIVGF